MLDKSQKQRVRCRRREKKEKCGANANWSRFSHLFFFVVVVYLCVFLFNNCVMFLMQNKNEIAFCGGVGTVHKLN